MGVYKSELGRSAVIENRMSTAKAVDKGRALETQSGTLAGAHGGDGDTCKAMAERGERALPLLFVNTSEPSGSKIDGRDLVTSGEFALYALAVRGGRDEKPNEVTVELGCQSRSRDACQVKI